MSKIVGIDLGTTNSVVAVLENNRPEVIQNAEGGKTTPSVIYFDPSGEVIVGDLARRQRITHPERTIYSVKRFMGCRWDEVADRMEGIAYPLEQDEEGMVTIRLGEHAVRPEEISAQVLMKMKETAEAFIGEEVTNAVITVPAHFNDSQRTATKIAGEKAGLIVNRIVNEPTAAALAYGLTRMNVRQKVAVFDFGGGTFDISILDIDGDILEVKSTGGDTYLGGDNINQILVQWIVDHIKEATGIDPSKDLQAYQRIVETSEKIKCELSTLNKTMISLPFIVADATGPKHFNADLTREDFNVMIASVIEKLRAPCLLALADAKMEPRDLSTILLVGGSTRIPAVRTLVKEIFGREPDCSLNPDEVVAQGAAVQGGVMSGELEEILLLDVTPLSLGIELAGNIFSSLIPRNSNLPATVGKRFTTVVDNQSTVTVHVLQGERKIATQNRSLGRFKLTGIRPAPKEIPEIEVSFNLNADGILTVSAIDTTSGSTQKVEIESYVPGAADLKRIVEEAEAKTESDRLYIQKGEFRRRLNQMDAEFKNYLQRKDASIVLNDSAEQKIKEVLFRWDIALSGDNFDTIEAAERTAISYLTEIQAMFALKGMGGSSLGPADGVRSDSLGESKVTDLS